MKKISRFDSKTIKNTILNDFPDFKIKTIKLIENGWDNVVAEINGQYIFRFLKDPGDSNYRGIGKDFNREIELLDYLQDKISVVIPKVEFIGKTLNYTGYKKISGMDLTKKVFYLLNKQKKEKLIFDLANFLREVHSSLSINQARKMGFEDEDPKSYSNMIKRILLKKIISPDISDFVKETLKEYEIMVQKKAKLVFLYNDLHTENMAFDYKTKKLNGIFDFSDAMIGDINLDFSPLYKFDPYFMKAVVEKYQDLTGRKLNLRHMIIYERINELCDLAEFINKPSSKVYKQVMMRIKKWKKEINIFK